MTKSVKSEQVNKIGQANRNACETLLVGYEAMCPVESSRDVFRLYVNSMSIQMQM